MMVVRGVVGVIGLIAIAACMQAPMSVEDWSTVSMRLERGPCMGGCPIYSVEVRGDGMVSYEGVNFVAVTGSQTAQISPDAVRELFAKFNAAKFETLKPEYRGEITDGVTNRVTLSRDGRSKTVVNYMGYLAGMPAAVGELEQAIDAAAGTRSWVGENAF